MFWLCGLLWFGLGGESRNFRIRSIDRFVVCFFVQCDLMFQVFREKNRFENIIVCFRLQPYILLCGNINYCCTDWNELD